MYMLFNLSIGFTVFIINYFYQSLYSVVVLLLLFIVLGSKVQS